MTSDPKQRRLLRAGAPAPGESLRGLVADTCALNHVHSTWSVLQHCGMPYRNCVNISEAPHLATDRLATALGVAEDVVLRGRYPALSKALRSFGSMPVADYGLENAVRRFSPAAIASGTLHHPATHELRELPFSTVGWDVLRDTCPCTTDGVRQGWTRTNGTARCDDCGRRLDRIDPVMVPDALRPPLGFLVGLVDFDPRENETALAMLPEELRTVERALLFDTCVKLGRSVAGAGRAGDLRSLDGVEALARGCTALLDWPEGFKDLRPSAKTSSYLWDRVRRNYLVLDVCGGASATAPPASHGSSGEALRAGFVPGYATGTARTDLLRVAEASRLVSIDEGCLKQAWDDGEFTRHEWAHGDNRVRAFDRGELLAIAPTLRIEKARRRLSYLLDVPVYGVEGLLASDLLQPEDRSFGRNQITQHLRAGADFLERLAAGQRDIADPMPLREAARQVSGRPKPWAAIFEAMLAGDVPFSLAPGDGGLVSRRLTIPREFARAFANLADVVRRPVVKPATRWAQRDALECVNGNESVTGPLRGLTWTGNHTRYYAPHDVIARAAQGVTTSDLARRTDLHTSQVIAKLKAAGTSLVCPNLWDRTAAEERLARYLASRHHV